MRRANSFSCAQRSRRNMTRASPAVSAISCDRSRCCPICRSGWVRGLVWIMMTVMSTFVGFRLMTRPSPYRRLAQIFFPALFATLLQGFQIDIDHWRQLYIMLGAVWGLEAARQRWAATQGEAARSPPLTFGRADALAPAPHRN